MGMAELSATSGRRRGGASPRPPATLPAQIGLWFAARVAQVLLYVVLGWVITAVTGERFLDNEFTELVGAFGVFIALPVSLLVSVVAWTLPWAPQRPGRRDSWILVGFVLEVVAVMTTFLAWLPNTPVVVVIDFLLALSVSALLPVAKGWRPNPSV